MASTTNRVVSTVLKIHTDVKPTTIDLPASSGDPAEISVPDRCCQIVMFFYAAAELSWDDSVSAAKTDMDASQRLHVEEGDQISLDCSGMNKNFYVRSTGSLASNGLTYFFNREG